MNKKQILLNLMLLPVAAMAQHSFDAIYSRTRRLVRSLIRTRLCRLPEQEPSVSSISQTAFIQRNPAKSYKVIEKTIRFKI